MSVCVCAGKPPRRHTPPLHDLIFHHKSVSQRDVLLCSLLWSNNLWAEHGGRQGRCTSVVSRTNTQAPVTLFIKGERARKRVRRCVFVYKSLHANTKWTRAQLGLRCGPQQRKHDSDSHIQSFTHTSTHTHLRAPWRLAQLRPVMDWLHSCRDRRAMDGEPRRWREERDGGGGRGGGRGGVRVRACVHARVVLEERKRAECSGLGAREDLTRGPSRSFPPRQHVSFPLNKQPFCGHERGWRSALSISPLSPLPLPPSVLLYLLYEPLCVCVWVGGVCIIYAY